MMRVRVEVRGGDSEGKGWRCEGKQGGEGWRCEGKGGGEGWR
jgi:hypothetical protein